MIKAKVIQGRFEGEEVRISNVSLDELGRKKAACLFKDGTRANLLVSDLEVIKEGPEAPRPRSAKTASPSFISGAASSRTLTQTKNMNRLKTNSLPQKSESYTGRNCEICGQEYNLEERKSRPGKITECEDCSVETSQKMEGKMVFSHKTGATIEITKDGELIHEAETFDPKNKS